MRLEAFLAGNPKTARITLADVGSAGGLKDRWRVAREIVDGVLFEPRDGGEIRREGNDTIYPLALGASAGQANLNITRLPNMSSVLSPNISLLQGFKKKGSHAEVVGHQIMPVDTLDEVVAREGHRIDALKIDTQGSELEILKGADACLSHSVILAEIEVSFFTRYVDQPLAADIMTFMHRRGFGLLDFHRLKRYRLVNAAGISNISLGLGQRAGRLAYGDALFVLSDEQLNARIADASPVEAEATVLRAITMLLVYGKPDVAAALFDKLERHLSPTQRDRVKRFLKNMSGLSPRNGIAHHMLDYLARHV